MKLKPYPDYKESFVGWLGEIPSHWDLMPTWSVLTRKKELVGSKWSNYDLLSLTKQGIILRDISSGKGKFPESFDVYQKVNPGDLVFCLFDVEETPRTVGLSPAPGMVTGAYTRMIVDPNHALPEYLEYYFVAIDDEKRMRPLYSGLRNVIPVDSFMQARIGLPSIKEQQTIITLLDRETAEIDAFIAEAERLIELLNERRTAAITQAVTKGLNPDTPMKDSGIEWLGEVPEHWDIQRISWLFDSTASGTTPSQDDLINPSETTVPWVVSGELREKSLFGSKLAVSEDTIKKYSALAVHPCGSLLIAMYGATIGRMAILGVDATSNQAICALVGAKGFVDIAFVQFALLAGRERLILDAAGGGQPNINQDKIRAFRIPLPPLNEQVEIHDFLEDKTSEIDAAIGAAREGIALARERRQALISAAVTGKIDVRSAL